MKRILSMTMAAAMTAASAVAAVPTTVSAEPSDAYVTPHQGGHNYRDRDRRGDRRDWDRRGDRRDWNDRRGRHRDRDDGWGAAAAGTLFGLTLGTLAGRNDGSYRGGNWDAHVNWCQDRYQTYNPRTDLYYYAPGRQRHCNSPYA